MIQKESNQVKHVLFHEERKTEKNGASAMRQEVEQREKTRV